MTTDRGLAVAVFIGVLISNVCQCATDTATSPATTDNESLPTVEAPLALGCSICKTLMNTTIMHQTASLTELTQLLTKQCSDWDFFKDICMKTVTMYAGEFREQIVNVSSKPNIREICQHIGLCSKERVPAFCNKYYHDEENGPPI